MDIVLTILRIASIMTSSILAIISLWVEVYDRNSGKLTRQGWWVLGIACASLIIGVGTTLIEGTKALRDAAEQQARTEKILGELTRAMQPITRMNLVYFIELPAADPGVKAYSQFLRSDLRTVLPKLRQFPSPADPSVKGLSIAATDSKREPEIIAISPESTFWPSGDVEYIGQFAQMSALTTSIWREPQPEDLDGSTANADIENHQIIAVSVTLHYNLKTSALEIMGLTNGESGNWHRSGRITSIVDLWGAQIIFRLPGSLGRSDITGAALRDSYQQLLEAVNLTTVSVEVGEGRKIWLTDGSIQKNRFKFGNPVFSAVIVEPEDPKMGKP